MDSEYESDEELQVTKPKRKWYGKITWTLMEQWVTGEKAEMVQEDFDREFSNLHVNGCWHPRLRSFRATLIRKQMLLYGRSFASTPRRRFRFLSNCFDARCVTGGCMVGIRIIEGPMDSNQCGNSQQGFGVLAVSWKLQANKYTMFSGFIIVPLHKIVHTATYESNSTFNPSIESDGQLSHTKDYQYRP